MSGPTRIEWADKVWNPVVGCTPVSAGCAHCYAKRIHERFYQDKPFSMIQLHPERIEQPFRWMKPSRVFVNSMSDLFHEDVPDEFIHSVFSVMATAENQTFLILTKRPERMKKFCSKFGRSFATDEYSGPRNEFLQPWPLPNVWLGVTAENQKATDERIPLLLETPAAVRFVSVEPMLGPVDLGAYLFADPERPEWSRLNRLHWVICGGETGPGARPMHPDWVRDLRDQCLAAGVPFFFKSWGEWTITPPIDNPRATQIAPGMQRVGKKRAGRILDGREWNQFPQERNKE